MKILLVTDLYPLKDNHRGIPLALENFALAWRDLGHEVMVLRPELILNSLIRGRKIYPQGEYEHNGIKIYNKNFFLPTYFGLNFLDKENFDVIISHMPSGTLCAAKIKQKFPNLPHVATVHASDIEVLNNYKIYFSSALKRSLNNADLVGARSCWLRDKLAENGVNCDFMAPSGIKKEEVASCDISEKFNNPKGLKIVCCASFIKRKNIMLLIEAIKNIKDININLEIFGAGSEEKKLKHAAKNNKNIEFMGQKPRQEILEALKKSHVFILPSINETFGLSYLEALAQGCIVVCTKSSGMDGFIENAKNGYTINPTTRDIEKIIRKIAANTSDENKKIAYEGIKTSQELEYYKCAKNYLENVKKIM